MEERLSISPPPRQKHIGLTRGSSSPAHFIVGLNEISIWFAWNCFPGIPKALAYHFLLISLLYRRSDSYAGLWVLLNRSLFKRCHLWRRIVLPIPVRDKRSKQVIAFLANGISRIFAHREL